MCGSKHKVLSGCSRLKGRHLCLAGAGSEAPKGRAGNWRTLDKANSKVRRPKPPKSVPKTCLDPPSCRVDSKGAHHVLRGCSKNLSFWNSHVSTDIEKTGLS